MAAGQGILNLYGGDMWPQIKQWCVIFDWINIFSSSLGKGEVKPSVIGIMTCHHNKTI